MKSTNRLFLAVVVLTWLLISCGNDDSVDTTPVVPQYISTDVSFETSDSITIAAILDKPTDLGSPAPAVLLIHSDGKDKSEWRALQLFSRLKEKNYVLFAYDIRFHGESEKDQALQGDLFTNPDRAPLDLTAAIDYLKSDPLVDDNRIAVIGSRLGAELACVAAGSVELGIKTAIALTPLEVSVITLSSNTPDFQMASVFYIASELELNGFKAADAQRLFDETLDPRKIKIVLGSDASGTEMTSDNSVTDEMVEWINTNL